MDWCLNRVEVETDGKISLGPRANKYALIFSAHSLGLQDIGLFKDETSDKAMKTTDFYSELLGMIGTKKELEDAGRTQKQLVV